MPFDIPSLQRASLQPAGNTDLARYILTHANVDWSKAANVSSSLVQPKGKPPGVLSRILDIMSRPSYAVDEMARRFIEHEGTTTNPQTGETTPINPQKHSQGFIGEIADILHGGASGLAGTQKTTWSKTLSELNPNSSPVARYGGGFLLDLLTDPTTYFGPGIAKSVIRGARGAKDVLPEAKGLISIVRRGPEAAPVAEKSPELAPAVSRASQQVSLPDFHSPGMPVQPKFSPIKLPGKFAAPTQIAPSIIDKILPSNKAIAQWSTKISSHHGTGPFIEYLSNELAKHGYEVDRPELLKQLSAARDTERAALASGDLDKAHEVAKYLGRGFFPLKSDIKEFPNVSKLSKAFQPAAVTHAGDIVDKIARGEIGNLAKPVSKVSPASPSSTFWATREAKQFADNVLSKPNAFAKVAGKTPAPNNPAQQANLFLRFANKIAPQVVLPGVKNPNATKFIAKRYTEAYRMMKVAENYFRSKGLAPTFWDGSHVALTDVIDELGHPAQMTKDHLTQIITAFKNKDPSKITDPAIRDAIERVRARDAMSSAKWARLALDQNSQSAKVAEQVLSKPKYNDFAKKLISDNAKTLKATTEVSPVGIKSTQQLLKEILIRNGTPPQLATDAKKTYIQLYSTPGSKKIKWLPVQAAQTKALETVLDSKPSQLGKTVDKNNEAENWFLSRFATWYGQKDLRPAVVTATMGAMNNASARAKIWDQVAKDYNPDEIREAFKVAQGHILSPSSTRVSDLGMQFQKAMENLFGSTGVTQEAQKASSVVLRSGALIQDLNEQLRLVRSPFRFTQAKDIKDFMGNVHNYSKGVDWLRSWEVADIPDPLDFIMRVETATEQLMHKYSFLDEVAARWGSKVRSKIFSTPVAGRTKLTKEITVGRLDGMYFPKELVPQINKALDTWHQIYNPKSDLIRFLDKVTRAWKSGVTVYAPSHHIRNFIGDVYLSWLAGVNNPSAYTVAGKVLKSQNARYKSLETIGDLTGKNAIGEALTRPGKKILTTKAGVDLTPEQIYIAAHAKGLLSHVSVIEDLIGDPLIKAQPFNGKVKDFVHSASELREHYVRIAHFVDALKKSRERDLPRLFSTAANEVRKWHPDGMDLTQFEREKMKRIFPFYSWTRKTIPLMVEGAVQKPGKILAYPRAMYALQGSLGINAPGPTDPFPTDQLFPNWIKAKGIGPIMGGAGDYTIINPSNPFNDIVSQYLGTGRPRDVISGLGSSLNPLARVPAELMTGTTVLGQPVDQDLNRYATEQIPIASLLSRMFNMGVAGPTNKAQKSGMLNQAALINFLTALGVQPTAPYIKQAQFEKKKGQQ